MGSFSPTVGHLQIMETAPEAQGLNSNMHTPHKESNTYGRSVVSANDLLILNQ